MGQAGLRRSRRPRRVHPEPDAVLRAHRGLFGGHHIRHECRVRLRLPPRQHGRDAPGHRSARLRLRDRGRGRLDPHRRGANAAHHLRRARDRGAGLLRLRARREDARGPAEQAEERGERPRRDRALGGGLPLRREVQDRLTEPERDRQDRARPRDREPLRRAQRPVREPPEPGAEGAVAVPQGPRLRDPGRRGEDRRRVHRPDHGRAPLVGGPPPGGRGEGGRGDPGGERHAWRRSPSRTTSASTRSSPA